MERAKHVIFEFKSEKFWEWRVVEIANDDCHTRDEDPTFFSLDPDPAQLKKNPDQTII